MNDSLLSAPPSYKGILLVDKMQGNTSFNLVRILRKRFGVKKIGHAGTLDPFATGVMVMLIGKEYTKLSDTFLNNDKEYLAEVQLGKTTDTYDSDGKEMSLSTKVPSPDEILAVLNDYQGEIEQIPPMYSAKKINGKKLYELARNGIEVERKPVRISLRTELISYDYPFLHIRVTCSKGTYIRSIAHEVGRKLGCGAFLNNLRRTRSGNFSIESCVHETLLNDPNYNLPLKLLTL